MRYFVYVLAGGRNGTLYVGVTYDLKSIIPVGMIWHRAWDDHLGPLPSHSLSLVLAGDDNRVKWLQRRHRQSLSRKAFMPPSRAAAKAGKSLSHDREGCVA